ncbi:MAG: serine/threonine protein kinase/formylglycine-generating enzyme required for sulfatase activity [Glaciecola sp.]|jgi:serine/threonine protein kinase/formylglycine-generating enzyme required for sulfatase activity
MDWDSIFRLVDQARAMPADQWQAFLDAECKGDPALKADVLRILQAEPEKGFIEPPGHVAGGMFGGGLTGREFADFTLLDEIARGGMGVVYRARQKSLNRTVAIKVLPRIQRSKPDTFERFLRETNAASSLQHPHAVPVLAAGETEGIAWYAMPFVDGHDLAAELQAQKETPDKVLLPSFTKPTYVAAVVQQIAGVAEALQQAHDLGITHRDIKPRNLLLNQEAQLFLVDFGLAKIHDMDTLTETDAIQGTPFYMSPEQARILRIPIDHRTDIYSLCVVLYETLCLRRPYNADSAEGVLGQIASGTHLSLRKANPRTPRDLVLICEKGMSHNPAHRYATAGELAADLNRFLRLEAVIARPAPLHRRITRYVVRHKLASMAALLVFALLGAVWTTDKVQAKSRQNQGWKNTLQASIAEEATPIEIGRAVGLLAGFDAGGHTPPGLMDLTTTVRNRLQDLRTNSIRDIEDHLQKGRGGYLEPERFGTYPVPPSLRDSLQAVVLAQEARLAFPGDAELTRLAAIENVFPTISVRLAPDSAALENQASVWAVPFDPYSSTYGAARSLGRAPLTDFPLAPGEWRIVVSIPGYGFGEYDRILSNENQSKPILARVLATEQVRIGMVEIRVPDDLFDTARETEGQATRCSYVLHSLPLPPYLIDEAVLTNGQFWAFLQATGQAAPRTWGGLCNPIQAGSPTDWKQLPVSGVGDKWLDLPALRISTLEAQACAEYYGKRLASHHEMEFALQGPDKLRFPWGEGPQPGSFLANTAGFRDASLTTQRAKYRSAIEQLLPARIEGYRHPPFDLFHAYGNVSQATWGPILEGRVDTIVYNPLERYVFGSAWNDRSPKLDLFAHATKNISDNYVSLQTGFRLAKTLTPLLDSK